MEKTISYRSFSHEQKGYLLSLLGQKIEEKQKLLQAQGLAFPKTLEEKAITEALQRHDREQLKQLLQENIEKNNIVLVEKILSSCTKQERYPLARFGLSQAVFSKNSPMLQLICHYGSLNSYDENGTTAVIEAILRHSKEDIEFLVKNGANLDVYERNGWTPLTLAVYQKDKEMVALLVKQGARLDLQNHNKKTPLMVAQELHDDSMVELLQTL